jgi:hypothetical protein
VPRDAVSRDAQSENLSSLTGCERLAIAIGGDCLVKDALHDDAGFSVECFGDAVQCLTDICDADVHGRPASSVATRHVTLANDVRQS